ncbi:MAG TPA: hypothetical protein VG435_07035 [Acidimicrobiales bacterium]|nr:hypothetical protein [Acidimicrobiales bacterium]
MNASLTATSGGLRERTPDGLRIDKRQIALALVFALAAAFAVVYTIDASATGAKNFQAVVTSAARYDLNFPNTGQVVSILVTPGRQVKAGQLLARQSTGTLDAQVAADQSAVNAASAIVQQDANPSLVSAQLDQYKLKVAQANSALGTAQAALSSAQSAAETNVSSSQAAVAADQTLVSQDATRYNQACPKGPVAPTSGLSGSQYNAAETQFKYCQNLQATYDRDQAQLSADQPKVSAAEAQGQANVGSATAEVKSAQSDLQLAQNELSVATSPSSSAALAQAQAQLTDAQSKLASAKQALGQAVLTAPADGTVSEVFGSPGEFLGPDGVKIYQSPQGASDAASSGFQLFPSSSNSSAGASSSTAGTEPLIEIVGGQQQVSAQVPQSDIGKFSIGKTASVRLSALGVSTTGKVVEMYLNPSRGTNNVDYQVVLQIQPVTGLLPGMSAVVSPPRS